MDREMVKTRYRKINRDLDFGFLQRCEVVFVRGFS